MARNPSSRTNCTGMTIEVCSGDDPRRMRCEKELSEAGISLPLYSRDVWTRLRPPVESWFILAKNSAAVPRGGIAVMAEKSRLPGYLIGRAVRVGPSLCDDAISDVISEIADIVRSDRRLLRISIELYSPNAAHHAAARKALMTNGFRQTHSPRTYQDTLLLDLRPSEAEIFQKISKSARRNIKMVRKRPVQVSVVLDPCLIPRLRELERETMLRSGASYTGTDWETAIMLSRENPNLSRLVGLWRTDVPLCANALLACAWSCNHGVEAEYKSSASTRRQRIDFTMTSSLIWDLLTWAKQNGAMWFDFGGVTSGSRLQGDVDSLSGVSDFKRHFNACATRVGEEWVLQPGRLSARFAQLSSAFRKWLD
jgi:hypothetical protein